MADTETEDDKLQELEHRIEQMELIVDKAIAIMNLAEIATLELRDKAVEALQAIITIMDAESSCLRTRAIEVVNAAGQPMVSIRASDCGGSLSIRAGSGEEAVAIGTDENCSGVLVVRDPAGLATAGLQIRDGRGELLTGSTTGETCVVGPGRAPAKD